MKLIKEQRSYTLVVPHQKTLESAFIWWNKRMNKYCSSFCPLCEYYFRCQEDVELEKIMGGK